MPISDGDLDEPSNGWMNYEDAPEMRRRIVGRTWHDLDAKFVDEFHEALIFAGPKTFALMLPAYLDFLLKLNGFSHALYVVAGQLTRQHDPVNRSIFDARIAAFTDEQRNLLRDIVSHLATRPAMERAMTSAQTTFQEFA